MTLDEMLHIPGVAAVLERNPHHELYDSVAQWLEGDVVPTFADDAARKRCEDTDTLWVFRVYPDTPIGFYWYAAPTLAELMALVGARYPDSQ